MLRGHFDFIHQPARQDARSISIFKYPCVKGLLNSASSSTSTAGAGGASLSRQDEEERCGRRNWARIEQIHKRWDLNIPKILEGDFENTLRWELSSLYNLRVSKVARFLGESHPGGLRVQ